MEDAAVEHELQDSDYEIELNSLASELSQLWGQDIFARKYMYEQEILQIVTNLITPRALFSPTYLLNLANSK